MTSGEQDKRSVGHEWGVLGTPPQHSHVVRGTEFHRLQYKAEGREALTVRYTCGQPRHTCVHVCVAVAVAYAAGRVLVAFMY